MKQICHLWPSFKEIQYIKFGNLGELEIYVTWQFTYTIELDFPRVGGGRSTA